MNDDGSARLVRTNITDEIIRLDPGAGQDAMAKKLKLVLENANPHARNGIIFCASKKKWTKNWNGPRWYGVDGTVAELANIMGLNRNDLIATYKGGTHGVADRNQQIANKNAFLAGQKRIMVATNAFGTGIDMPHVDWVVHVGMPSGLEAYYQEIGRAGRSGQEARAWLLYDQDANELVDALVAARQSTDSLSALRDLLSTSSSGLGSIARQLNLLVGSESFSPSPLLKINTTLPDKPDLNPFSNKANKRPVKMVLPSFPGIECEHDIVDNQILEALKLKQEGSEADIVFHLDWDALVWKAIIRFKALGLIGPIYRRSFGMQGSNVFVVTKTDWNAQLGENVLVPAFERAVRLMRSKPDAEVAAKDLREHIRGPLAGNAPVEFARAALRRLLDHSYALMRDARLGSLMEMRSYALEPDPLQRQRMIEDYFARGSYFQKIAQLSEVNPSLEDWQQALDEARGLGSKRRGVFLRVLSGRPDAKLAAFLLIEELLRFNDDEQLLRFHLGTVLFNESLEAPIHRWVWRMLIEAAGGARPKFEGLVATAIRNLPDDRRTAVAGLMLASLDQAEGDRAVADAVIGEFGRIALRRKA